MKRTLITTLILIVAVAAVAAPPRPRGGEGEPHVLAEFLGLSDAQKAQIEPLRETMHAEIIAAREKFDASFEALLTPEQKAKWEMVQQLREARRQRPDGAPRR